MISVFGLGFVGLTTSLGFCEKGKRVWGVDSDLDRLNKLKNGKVPFWEPGLTEALNKHSGNLLTLTNDSSEAIKNSSVHFICVGTPSQDDGSADLTYVLQCVDEILKKRDPSRFQVIVIKSTVPPGTSLEIVKPYIEKQGLEIGKDIGLANNPEFLREGYAWDDFIKPDRVVIGESDDKSGALMEELYSIFNSSIYRVTLNTGEFIKYLSNTLLSTLISFANDMSIVADKIGSIEVSNAFRILHKDQRWFGNPAGMKSYVYPGCGFGGYCLPKDTKALYSQAQKKGYTPTILKEVLEVNDKIKTFVVDKIKERTSPKDTIGILGLSFKPGSDDIRDTPAKPIIESLLASQYKNIIAYDPMAIDDFKKVYNLDISYANSLEEVTEKADHLVILTAWKEFIENNKLLAKKPVSDFRYCLPDI